jgi:hypothetical protein
MKHAGTKQAFDEAYKYAIRRRNNLNPMFNDMLTSIGNAYKQGLMPEDIEDDNPIEDDVFPDEYYEND